MKINWGKVAQLVPQVLNAIDTAETFISGAKNGKVKKEAVLDYAGSLLKQAEVIAEKDFAKDEKVQEALGNLIDAYVNLQNAVRAAKSVPNKGDQ